MTAVPDWEIARPTDAELAGAAAAGDRGAFAAIYDRYADRLHDFCVGMLRDGDAAADCVQDAFCTAAAGLARLREPDKLRPWLYAIARNEALRRIRDRRRERVFDELPDAASSEPGPDVLAARSELADLVAEAAGGLSDRDRSVLELSYRHGLDVPELAEALGVSHGSAKKVVQRLRDTMERSLGALLVARRARATRNGCCELAAVVDGWDGQFTVLMRKRIARHIESCLTCEEDRRQLVNPVALLGGVPVFIPAPGWLRQHTLDQVQLSGTTIDGDTADSDGRLPHTPAASPPGDRVGGRGMGRLILIAAVLLGTVLTAAGLAIAWWYRPHTAITPSNVSNTVPAPTNPVHQPRIVGTTPTISPSATPTASTTPATTFVAPSASAPPADSAGPIITAPALPSPVPSSAPLKPSTGPTTRPAAPPAPVHLPVPPPASPAPSTLPTGIVPSHGAPRPPATISPPTLF